MPFSPSIHGQLEWDSKRKEVQYIVSWPDHASPSERVTSMYGNVAVFSEGRASNVAVLTELVPAKSGATIHHANGKISVEIPADVNNDGHDLYFALSSGYNIDPPEGKMFVAGGVAYNTTALPLTENEENRVELTELGAAMTLWFNYSADMPKETLEVCYLDPNVQEPSWSPVAKAQVDICNGVATVTTKRLGAYALMMRKEISLSDVKSALAEATKAIQDLERTIDRNGADSLSAPALTNGDSTNGAAKETGQALAG